MAKRSAFSARGGQAGGNAGRTTATRRSLERRPADLAGKRNPNPKRSMAVAGANRGEPPRQAIAYSDIPNSTPGQLKSMRRIGRPPLGAEARQLIAIRLDRQVLAAVRREARRQKAGYQSLIHEVLARYARRVA